MIRAICRYVLMMSALVLSAPPAIHGQPLARWSELTGRVIDAQGHRVEAAKVALKALPGGDVWTRLTGADGTFLFDRLAPGRYQLDASKPGFVNSHHEVSLGEQDRRELVVALQVGGIRDAVHVVGDAHGYDPSEFDGLSRMSDIRETALFAGKKTDVIALDRINANLAEGNTRQVFGKVPGTNIWENDGAGLQVGISNRGLDPNRSWEMNSRQNGYDITADIFGYPEAYFTPPLEAVERIEVVRGAASLQYGAQFGGLVNYVLKEAPPGRRFTFTSEQTVGSTSLFNSHNRLGGRVGRLSYNGYYHHREANGWRQNSGYDANFGFGAIKYDVNDKLRIGFELTKMRYVLQMAGGLTEQLFQQDARLSLRPRNWFELKWLVPSLKVDYTFDPSTRLTVNAYAIRGVRHSLFNSEPVAFAHGELNPDDPADPRTLYIDRFHNIGVEARVLRQYQWRGRSSVLAAGVRGYRGKTVRQHGLGFPGPEAIFEPFVPDVDRNMHFHNVNFAGFAENAFHVTGRLTVTPGLRLDHLDSTAEGRPIVGTREQTRLIPLGGIGVTYRASSATTLYGNISRAYRATLFNDQWRSDPSITVDPNVRDMTGYVSELGWRGRYDDWLSFDFGAFYLKYGDRLGLLTGTDAAGRTVSVWTNVSDSRNIGLESLIEGDVLRLLTRESSSVSLRIYTSIAAIDSQYLEGVVRGNRVEMAPGSIVRSGVTYRHSLVSVTLQHSHVGDQFTDANNTRFTVDGVQGRIPAYRVWDLSGTWRFRQHYIVRGAVNNLGDARYFTRRATSYPGPGVIPADGRRVNLTFGVEY